MVARPQGPGSSGPQRRPQGRLHPQRVTVELPVKVEPRSDARVQEAVDPVTTTMDSAGSTSDRPAVVVERTTGFGEPAVNGLWVRMFRAEPEVNHRSATDTTREGAVLTKSTRDS